MANPFLVEAPVPDPMPRAEPRPWGFWSTILFSFLVVALFVVIQTMVVVGCIVAQTIGHPQADSGRLAHAVASSGLCLALATWSCMPPCVALVWLWVRLRPGWTFREYLALRPIPLGVLGGWLGLQLVFVALSDGLTWLLGRPIVPPFMTEAYQTAYWAPLLWAALLVASPICEETVFRGFLLRGILHSHLGTIGALLIPAFAWTVLHLQYDAYALAHVFAGGILLAAARLKTGSLYVPLAMHSLMNFVATCEVAVQPWFS